MNLSLKPRREMQLRLARWQLDKWGRCQLLVKTYGLPNDLAHDWNFWLIHITHSYPYHIPQLQAVLHTLWWMVDHSFPKSVIQIHNRIHLDLAKDAVAKDRYISLDAIWTGNPAQCQKLWTLRAQDQAGNDESGTRLLLIVKEMEQKSWNSA